MASDVIESEAVLKGVSDMNLNNSSPDFGTPSRTHEELGNRHTSSPSSSGVSGEGDEEELEELENSTASTIENGEEALQESLTKTRGTPQERTNPDNEQTQPGATSSTPVSLPQPRSPPGPIGRSVSCLHHVCFMFSTCWQIILSSVWCHVSIARMLFSQTQAPEPDDCLCSSVCQCF